MIVNQVGGLPASFNIDVFNAAVAVEHSLSSGGGDPDGEYAASPDNYRVIPTQQSDAPGRMQRFLDYSMGAFVNADVVSPTNRRRRIYIEIELDGSGDMSFDLTLGCEVDIG